MIWLALGEYRGPHHPHALLMYAVERFRDRQHVEAFRTYVADSLRAIPQGGYMQQRYSEIIHPMEAQRIDVEAVVDGLADAGLEVI